VGEERTKKRKESNSDDESETKDCFLLKELFKDIDGFNYNDMEKLTLEEGSDEVSVLRLGKDVSISSDEVDNYSISSDQMSTQPELFALDKILARDSDSDSSDEDSFSSTTVCSTSSEEEDFDSLDECREAYSLAEYIQTKTTRTKDNESVLTRTCVR
jgi:hypothetical protein